MTLEDIEDMNELLNRTDRETHPQTANEVGEHGEYPEWRYDEW